jgi:hypothetical protein
MPLSVLLDEAGVRPQGALDASPKARTPRR